MFKVGDKVTGNDFIGREAEIRRILSAMKDGNNISIYGMARIGKSSIIKEIIYRIKHGNVLSEIPFFFEYNLTRQRKNRFYFFQDLKYFVSDKIDEYTGDNVDCLNSLKKIIVRIEKGLENDDVNHERYIRMCDKFTTLYERDLWIIIDEMDYANTAFGDYIQKIREIVNSSDRVHAINISRHSLSSIFPINGNGSNYPGIISQNIPIVGFSPEDMEIYKTKFNAYCSDIDEQTWSDILHYAGNIPYFLSIIANGLIEDRSTSVAEIAENPYGKYADAMNYWYQTLCVGGMLENAVKFVYNSGDANINDLIVYGIIRDGKFTVPWFAEYIKTQNITEHTADLIADYISHQETIPVLVKKGRSVLQGILRDQDASKNVSKCINELEAMDVKISAMKKLYDLSTFVQINPSVDEINAFYMRMGEINDLFEQLS